MNAQFFQHGHPKGFQTVIFNHIEPRNVRRIIDITAEVEIGPPPWEKAENAPLTSENPNKYGLKS